MSCGFSQARFLSTLSRAFRIQGRLDATTDIAAFTSSPSMISAGVREELTLQSYEKHRCFNFITRLQDRDFISRELPAVIRKFIARYVAVTLEKKTLTHVRECTALVNGRD